MDYCAHFENEKRFREVKESSLKLYGQQVGEIQFKFRPI